MITCIAIDDEPLALELIEIYAKQTPSLQLLGTFTSAFEAIAFLGRNKVDLIISDIDMPDISGIQMVKSMQHKPLIIFATAYKEFAYTGFELDVLDFLLKPIDLSRFQRAINKAEQVLTQSQTVSQPVLTSQSLDYIFVKTDYKIVKVTVNEILYFEGYKDYVKIHCQNSPAVLSLISLKNIEEKMPSDKFARVHRSFIVAIDKIESIEKKRIKIGKSLIPISDSYCDQFFQAIERMNL